MAQPSKSTAELIALVSEPFSQLQELYYQCYHGMVIGFNSGIPRTISSSGMFADTMRIEAVKGHIHDQLAPFFTDGRITSQMLGVIGTARAQALNLLSKEQNLYISVCTNLNNQNTHVTVPAHAIVDTIPADVTLEATGHIFCINAINGTALSHQGDIDFFQLTGAAATASGKIVGNMAMGPTAQALANSITIDMGYNITTGNFQPIDSQNHSITVGDHRDSALVAGSIAPDRR